MTDKTPARPERPEYAAGNVEVANYVMALESYATALEAQLAEAREALKYAHEMLGWHADDDADENDTSPEDTTAHINGLVRRRIYAVLADEKEKP